MRIADKIKKMREFRNYTQEFMAAQIGITQAGYSKIERVSVLKLERICEVLEMDIAFSEKDFAGNNLIAEANLVLAES